MSKRVLHHTMAPALAGWYALTYSAKSDDPSYHRVAFWVTEVHTDGDDNSEAETHEHYGVVEPFLEAACDFSGTVPQEFCRICATDTDCSKHRDGWEVA